MFLIQAEQILWKGLGWKRVRYRYITDNVVETPSPEIERYLNFFETFSREEESELEKTVGNVGKSEWRFWGVGDGGKDLRNEKSLRPAL